jgi:hypothetical protein
MVLVIILLMVNLTRRLSKVIRLTILIKILTPTLTSRFTRVIQLTILIKVRLIIIVH